MSDHGEPASGRGLVDFSVDLEPQGDAVRIIPAGELDLASVGRLQSELEALIEAGFARIVIDLRPVEFIDSAGLHALISANARAKHNGWQLAIVPGRHAVQRIFEITGVIDQLPFTPVNGGVSTPELAQVAPPPGI